MWTTETHVLSDAPQGDEINNSVIIVSCSVTALSDELSDNATHILKH